MLLLGSWMGALSAGPQTPEDILLALPEPVVRQSIKTKAEPDIPATARQFHITGDVVVALIIGTDGRIEKIESAKGNQILVNSVTSALKKWSFTPFNSGGKPARVKTTLSFAFHL